MAFIDHGRLIRKTCAQGPPVKGLVFHAAVEVPAVAPFLVVDGIVAAVHIDVQGIVGGPAGPDRAHFKTQIVQRLVGNAQGCRIGQLKHGVCAAVSGLGQVFGLADGVVALIGEFHVAIDVHGHLTLVGQANRPLVVEMHVQAKVGAITPSVPLELHVVVKFFAVVVGQNFVAHVHVGVHGFHAYRKGDRIIELDGKGRHEGNSLYADVIDIVPARPVTRIAVAKAETRKNAQTDPCVVAELVAQIGVRSIPEGGLRVGRGFAAAITGGNTTRGADEGKAAHRAGAGQLRNACGIIGNGRNIISAAHHAASQGNTSGAPFIQGETFAPGYGRAAGHQSQRQTYSTKNLHHPSTKMQKKRTTAHPGIP